MRENLIVMDEWKNWKTINNVNDYETESDNPILKEDTHRAEIVDITDGLVVETRPESYFTHYFNNHEKINRSDVNDAFCTIDWSKIY